MKAKRGSEPGHSIKVKLSHRERIRFGLCRYSVWDLFLLLKIPPTLSNRIQPRLFGLNADSLNLNKSHSNRATLEKPVFLADF